MIEGFLSVSLIGIFAIFVSWIVTYEILSFVWQLLPKLSIAPRLKVMLISVPIFATHIFSIWMYALIFFMAENFTGLGTVIGQARQAGLTLESFYDCLYFSASTYTSLGTGDLISTDHLRMLASTEVLNGLVMIGWTISFTFLTMEKFWSKK